MFTDILQPLISLADDSAKKCNELTKEILELKTPPPGPYAIFHHFSHLVERIRDIKHILTRMVSNKERLVILADKERIIRPTVNIKPGKPLPSKLQKINSQHNVLTERMKLDMESLYIFGNLVLDQWAYIIAYLSGMPNPETVNFRVLVEQLQSKKYTGILTPLWQKHKRDLVWLYYQLRFYRSTFIEHVDRPWQRGSGGGVYTHDFDLFIPSPPGWLDDEKIKEDLESIFHLSPAWIREAPDDYWEKQNLRRMLEVTFNQIDDIENYSDREKVWNIWRKVGGSTPSYEVVARRLLSFLSTSIPTIKEIMSSNPDKVNLGKSAKNK